MRLHHLFCAGVLAAVLIGCQDKNPKSQSESSGGASDALLAQQTAPERAVALDEPSAQSTPPDDLELLVRKTEAHAQRVTEEMQRNGTLAQAATRPPVPSVVEWMSEDAYRIGSAPADETAAAAPAAHLPGAASAAVAAPRVLPAEPAPESGTANKAVALEETQPAPVALLTAPMPAVAAATPAESSLRRRLEQRVMDYPRDVAAQLDYQLLQFIQGKPVPDLSRLAALPEEDQEIITAILDGLTNFRNGITADPNLLLSRKVKPLIDAGERLRARSDLEIPVVELCRRVDGYGVYETVDHQFVAGQDRDVIVYCEVENFMSQFNEASRWETRLTEEVVLYTDSDGLPILRDKPTPVADLSRTRRSDFFIVRKIRLPGTIPVGRYWLKVTIVDQLASRVAEHSIPITFVAK